MSSHSFLGVWLLASIQLGALSACAEDVSLGQYLFEATGGATNGEATGGTRNGEATGGATNGEATGGATNGEATGGATNGEAGGGRENGTPETDRPAEQPPTNLDPMNGSESDDEQQTRVDDDSNDEMGEAENLDSADEASEAGQGGDGSVSVDDGSYEDQQVGEDAFEGQLTHASLGGAGNS